LPEQGRPDDPQDAYRLCHRPWQAADIDPIQAPRDLAVSAYEADFFKQVARLWNERLGDWRQFPEFLHLVYENRVIRETETIEESPAADAVTLPFPNGPQRAHRAA
jgi:hypothetical protein